MPVCEASPGAQHKRLRVWGRSRRIRGITSSLWWARSWPIRGPHCVPSTNQRPGRSDPLQWFPSLPPPGPVSVQILCKKKIAAKVHGKQQMQKYATITVEVICRLFSSLAISSIVWPELRLNDLNSCFGSDPVSLAKGKLTNDKLCYIIIKANLKLHCELFQRLNQRVYRSLFMKFSKLCLTS